MTIRSNPTPGSASWPDPGEPPNAEREWARLHIARRRKLRGDVIAFVVINSVLVVVWALTGAGTFWPAWVMLGWGTLLALDVWSYREHRPITDADIDRELAGRR